MSHPAFPSLFFSRESSRASLRTFLKRDTPDDSSSASSRDRERSKTHPGRFHGGNFASNFVVYIRASRALVYIDRTCIRALSDRLSAKSLPWKLQLSSWEVPASLVRFRGPPLARNDVDGMFFVLAWVVCIKAKKVPSVGKLHLLMVTVSRVCPLSPQRKQTAKNQIIRFKL